MPRTLPAWSASALVVFLLSSHLSAEEFDKTIAPILLRHCGECHLGSEASGGLDLRTHQSVLAGGDKGKVLVPGKPGDSSLLQRVLAGEMPPKKGNRPRLSGKEVQDLRTWIASGAPWPKGRTLDLFETSLATRGGRDWWSLQPIRRPAIPRSPHGASNPIDAFIQARLPNGWKPAPLADRRTLIRRVYYDLLGLPPTHEEVTRFVEDTSPDAYERLVDRLLASPHFGERWGRYWLDIVRYAETCGYERDQVMPGIWKYRDWVIRAFNEDKPYDRFLTEQLAGDETANRSESTVIATGFLRLGTWNDEPNDPNEYKYDRLEDMVHVTSTAFLGMTVKCARCHDHKFDPIRQTDYYRMASVFWAGFIEPGPRELLGGPDRKVLGYDVHGWTDRGTTVPAMRLLKKGDPGRPGGVVVPAQQSMIPALDRPMTKPSPQAKTTQRRLQLAQWMTDPRNPLTARVWANRLWQFHFGQALARTPDNLGFTGDKPTHPKLLDWLASELIRNDWQAKSLHRLLLTSHTYRQASIHPQQTQYADVDAGNRFWWRAERRRLDAEAIRDSQLLVSGLLKKEQMGGPSFSPEIAPDALEGLSMKSRAWKASPTAEQGRRSVYIFTKRGLLPPLLTTFDFSDTTLPNCQRDTTTVAPQALALLNNPFVHEQSETLAKRVLQRSADTTEQVRLAWRLALGRNLTASEQRASLAHLEKQRLHFATGETTAELPTRARVLHLRATEGVEADKEGRVQRWKDLSGKEHHAQQSIATARPQLVTDAGKKVIRFNGQGQFFHLDGQVLTSQQFSVFTVTNDKGKPGHRTLFSSWHSTKGNIFQSVFLGLTAQTTVRLSDDFAQGGDISDPQKMFILTGISGKDDARTYQNDRLLARKGRSLTMRNLTTPYVLGQQGNINGEWWHGDVTEVIAYDRELSENERRSVIRFLGQRHGIEAIKRRDPAEQALASLCHVLLNTNEFVYVD